jgi:hypothetical protein
VFTAAQSPVRDVKVRTVPEDTEVCIGDAQVGGAQLLPRTQP